MNISLAIGIIFLAGAFGGKLARYFRLPSVTGNMLAGILVGPYVLGLVDLDVLAKLSPINELALGIIALSIGAELRWIKMRKLAKDVMKVFLIESFFTLMLVFGLLYIMGQPFRYAIAFALISIATAPGAIIACIRETPIKGDFPRVLLSVVALDNLLAITLFAITISFMQTILIASETANGIAFIMALSELGISLMLGAIAGIFLIMISNWAKSDGRILVYVLGTVLVTVGMSNLWNTPALLSIITTGVLYTNFSKKPQRISRAMLNIETPILLLFLTLAGAKLNLKILPIVGLVGVVYISARFFAKLVGSRIGTMFTDFSTNWKHNLGRALTPQAGVAIGLAIIAEQKLIFEPDTIMPVILAAVVIFEIIGPILVRKSLCDVQRIQ